MPYGLSIKKCGGRVAKLYLIEQSALDIGGHYFSYTQCLASSAVELGFQVKILQNRRFNGDWGIDGVEALPAFTQTWGEAEGSWITEWTPGNIAFEMAEALRGQRVSVDDHILFSTLGYAELFAVLKYIAQLSPSSQSPTIHLLLRYDSDQLRNNIHHYRPYFTEISKSAFLRDRIRLHSDTQQLADDFSLLSGLPVTTLPIPFKQTHLRERLSGTGRKDGHAPKTVTYLGDARLEKGYGALPEAVSFLSDKMKAGAVRFTLQSNFNTPGGEAGMLAARQRLAQHPPSRVKLITNPMGHEEYYDVLYNADIVVIPYDAERYCRRSSGVLVEAMAAGKPVITTAGSWMASQVTDDHAVLIENLTDLGPAILKVVEEFSRYQAAAQAKAAQALENATGAHFIRSLLATASPRRSRDQAPLVLTVMNGDAMVLQNGASRVAESQFEYMEAAGYRTAALFLHYDRETDPAMTEQWTAALLKSVSRFDFEGIFVAGPGRFSTDIAAQSAARQHHEFSIRHDLAQVAQFDFDGGLFRYLLGNKIDAVLLNYITNYPVLESLGLTETPVICETVDVQSFQKAIYGRKPVSMQDVQLEMEYLDRCDFLIALNDDEAAYISDYLPEKPQVTTGIFPSLATISAGALAGCISVSDVLDAAGVGLETAQGVREATSMDLLFVSSNHSANVSGLRWFLGEVYLPHLADAGVSLFVAGSIVEAGGWPSHENLHFLGRTRDLDPLYAAAKIVVLPIIEGAGSPVKTYEAIQRGAAIVATGIGVRGVKGDLSCLRIADAPADFARHVRELLDSTELRREASAGAFRLARTLSDRTKYFDAMNHALHTAMGESALHAPPPPPLLKAGRFIEWGPLVEAVNVIVRDWLSERPLGETALDTLRREPFAEVVEVVTDVTASLFDAHDAPLLATQAELVDRIASFAARPVSETLRTLILDLVSSQKPQGADKAKLPSRLFASVGADLNLLAFSGDGVARGEAGSGWTEVRKNVWGWERPSPFENHRSLYSVVLPDLPPSCDLVVSQKVPLRDGAMLLNGLGDGHRPMPIVSETLTLRSGEVRTILAAGLYSDRRSALMVEVDTKGSSRDLEVMVDGIFCNRSLSEAGGGKRLFWSTEMDVVERVLRAITFRSMSGAVVITAVRMHLVFSDDPERRISEAMEAEGDTPQATALDGRETAEVGVPAVQDPKLQFLASGALTLIIEADVQRGGDVVCILDGLTLPASQRVGATLFWRRDGVSGDSEVLLHDLAFVDGDGRAVTPSGLRLRWSIPALQDPATKRQAIRSYGHHKPEGGHVWTGPESQFGFSLPLGLTAPAKIVFQIGHMGQVRSAADLIVKVNGQEQAAVLERGGGGGSSLVIDVPQQEVVQFLTVQLLLERMVRIHPDPRILGISLDEVEISQVLRGQWKPSANHLSHQGAVKPRPRVTWQKSIARMRRKIIGMMKSKSRV